MSDEELNRYRERLIAARYPREGAVQALTSWFTILATLLGVGALLVAFTEGVNMISGPFIAIGGLAGWLWHRRDKSIKAIDSEIERATAERNRRSELKHR